MFEEQSLKSNLVGNSAEHPAETVVSRVNGAQSVASSGAKLQHFLELARKKKKKVQNLIAEQRINPAEVNYLDLNL